jgi:hypothetical protein
VFIINIYQSDSINIGSYLKEIAKLQEAAGNSSEIQSKLDSEKNKAEEKIQEVNHFLPPIIQRNKNHLH